MLLTTGRRGDTRPGKTRLNDWAQGLLAVRQAKSWFADHFALVFMGDTHIGKICCLNDLIPENEYRRLLSLVLGEGSEDILCIVHGGDATDRGKGNLERFIQVTKRLLFSQAPDSILPFFLNIGNHEYLDDPKAESYRLLAGDPGRAQYIRLECQRLAIVLLDTGIGDRGGFEDAKSFGNQLEELEKEMHLKPDYRYIIDMHIPPSFGWRRLVPLVLNPRDNREFLRFLDRNPDRIMAVVTHHCHWLFPSCSPCLYRGEIPIFLTAHGGHCDFPRFACLRLTFSRASSAGWEVKPSLIRG